MPILLTTPLQQPALHGQPAASYGEVMIIAFGVQTVDKQLSITCQYGNTVGNEWQPSPLPSVVHTVENTDQITTVPQTPDDQVELIQEADPAYDLLMVSTHALSTTTLLYDEVSTSLYQYLIDEGIYDGSIV